MCFNCPDYVDYCAEGDCYDPNGGKYSSISKFYIGSKYCEHLRKKYGKVYAEYDDEEVDDELAREVDAKRQSQEATMRDLAADGY